MGFDSRCAPGVDVFENAQCPMTKARLPNDRVRSSRCGAPRTMSGQRGRGPTVRDSSAQPIGLGKHPRKSRRPNAGAIASHRKDRGPNPRESRIPGCTVAGLKSLEIGRAHWTGHAAGFGERPGTRQKFMPPLWTRASNIASLPGGNDDKRWQAFKRR